MEPKYVTDLSVPGSEIKHSQKFGLGAAQNRNVQTHDQFDHTVCFI